MIEHKVSMTQLREETARILNEVQGGAVYIVTRYGKPVAVLVPPEWIGSWRVHEE